MKQPKIYYVRWVLPPYRAITMPPFGIFIKSKYSGGQKILNHEIVHWKQYQRIGLFMFYFRYFKEFMVYGYDKMPMETEARYEEDEYTKKHYSEVYHNSKKICITTNMNMTKWDLFFNEKIKQIFENKKDIIDIGGGLRISEQKGNLFDPKREWIRAYLNSVNYKILDKVPNYKPDIIGDIHNLPLENDSVDAIICIAVLEHIENPFKAFEEMYRVLKKGGYCFIYMPFLYYYHAQAGYYGDFWRYTEDGLKHLSRNFSSIEIQHVRWPLETWIYLSPFGRIKFLNTIARMVDVFLKKQNSKQTSGYNVFLVK